jgi:tetratricopeptide (TPR) repeat protein
LFKKSVGTTHENYIKTELTIAEILLAKGYLDSANAVYRYYLPITEKMDIRQTNLRCVVLLNLGGIEGRKNNAMKANEYNKRCLDCALTHEKDLQLTLKAYSNLGITFRMSGNLDSSLYYYNLGDKYAQKTKQTETFSYAQLLNGFGNLYAVRNEPLKAIDYFLAATNVLQRNNLENNDLLPVITANLGRNYRLINQHQKAIEYYTKSINFFSTNPKLYASNLVQSYQMIGNSYRKLSQSDSVHYYLKKAIALQTQIPNSKGAGATLLTDYGNFFSEKEDFFHADSLYLQALAVQKKELPEKNQEIGITYYNLGFNQYRQKNYTKAIEWYKKSLFAYNYTEGGYLGANSSLRFVAYSISQIAKCAYLLNLNNKDVLSAVEAQKFAEQHLRVVQFVGEQMTYQNSKSALIDEAFPTYEVAVGTASDKYKAFEFSEASKALRLSEIMRENAAFVKSNIPDSVVQNLKKNQIFRQPKKNGSN